MEASPGSEVEKSPARSLKAEANLLRLPRFALHTKGLATLEGIECRGHIHRGEETQEYVLRVSRNAASFYPGPLSRKVHFAFLSTATDAASVQAKPRDQTADAAAGEEHAHGALPSRLLGLPAPRNFSLDAGARPAYACTYYVLVIYVLLINGRGAPMREEAHQLAMALRGAYLTMHRKADSFLAPYGVTADQYVLLSLLAEESEVTQQTLVVRAFSDPNTVRTMLLLLEGRGLVVRRPHPVDGRARSVSLTRKGRAVCRRLRTARGPFLAQLVSDFRPSEVRTLLGLLRRIPPVMAARASAKRRASA